MSATQLAFSCSLGLPSRQGPRWCGVHEAVAEEDDSLAVLARVGGRLSLFMRVQPNALGQARRACDSETTETRNSVSPAPSSSTFSFCIIIINQYEGIFLIRDPQETEKSKVVGDKPYRLEVA
jgi:hypothetical protein